MNQYPIWTYLMVALIVVTGTLYALPNLYGTDPSLQISPRRAAPVEAALTALVDETLAAAGIEPKAVETTADRMLIRFRTAAARRDAEVALSAVLDSRRYVMALNLAPGTPEWLRSIGGKPMYMGLDLRGGVHFLMEVDMDAVSQSTDRRFQTEIKAALREERIRYRSVSRDRSGGLMVRFLNEEAKEAGVPFLREEFRDLALQDLATDDGMTVKLAPTEEVLEETRRNALKQNLTTLRNRVNELGVAEPVIQQQGANRIVVQLPGVEDTAEAKRLLGATATLEFRMVDLEGDVAAAVEGKVPRDTVLLYERDGSAILLEREVMLTGDRIVNAAASFDQREGTPIVRITLDGKGATSFSRLTRDRIGKPMAVVYIEQVEGKSVSEVINVATIRDELGKQFQISGLDSASEASDLALLLRAGSLAAPIEIVEERTVGPSLGQENIDRGFRSVQVGMLLVLLFMAGYYRMFGLIADIALMVNLVLLIALLSMLQATLTLPGIAGIVLTIGMAVDANVLIFTRIREELRNGVSPQRAISSGYEKALSTIADSQITTLIAAVVLFSFGTGPIKGFAVTLSLGIMTSMFTAIIGTRALVNLLYGNRKLSKLAI